MKGWIGNVKGRDLLPVGRRDHHRRVHGNVALKTVEGALAGLAGLVFGVLDEPEWEQVAGALKLRMLEAATPLLPDSTGGALLLGVNEVCIISHGASSATAIVNGVRVARVRDGRRDRPSHHCSTGIGGGRVAVPAETDSHRGPVDRTEIERTVGEQLAEILEIDLDAVRPQSHLRDDLDADDYALIELVEAVEGDFGT